MDLPSLDGQNEHNEDSDSAIMVGSRSDPIDQALVRFLNTDAFGMTMSLPVIKLSGQGNYIIGMLKCSLR